MTDPINIIGVIDVDGNEALYVDGDLHPIDGNTIFFIDVANAAGDKTCQLSRVEISKSMMVFRPTRYDIEWPKRFEELLPYIEQEPAMTAGTGREQEARGA